MVPILLTCNWQYFLNTKFYSPQNYYFSQMLAVSPCTLSQELLIKQIACMQKVRSVPLAYTRDCPQASVVHTFDIIGHLYKSRHIESSHFQIALLICVSAWVQLPFWISDSKTFLCFRISQECDQYSILLTKRKHFVISNISVIALFVSRSTIGILQPIPIQCLHLHHEPKTNKTINTMHTNILDFELSFPLLRSLTDSL